MHSSSDLSENSDMEPIANAEWETTDWETTDGETRDLTMTAELQALSVEISQAEEDLSELNRPELSTVDQQLQRSTIYTPIQSQAPPSYDGDFSPEIRLLLLSPVNESQSGLHGSLESFRLSDAPSFIAVSYEWEGPRTRLEMNLDLQLGNDTVTLKPNLAHALACFRKRLRDPTYLWIDAICINQANVEERGQQVQIMSEIYQRARGVWIWLGPANHHSDLAMDVIDQVANFPEDMKGESSRPIKWIKRILHDDAFVTHRLALYALFRRSYWKRLWIVQELVLGACTDAPMLWCGDRLSALGHVSKLARGIRAALNMVQLSTWRQNITIQKLERSIKVVLDLAEHIDEHSDSAQGTKELNFFDLLMRYTGNQCTDPRDKIYALLGIARLRGARLQVDYSLSLEEVCGRTALYIIKTTERLDLLSSCLWQEVDQQNNSFTDKKNLASVKQIAPSPVAGIKQRPRSDSSSSTDFSRSHSRHLARRKKRSKYRDTWDDSERAKFESIPRDLSWVPKWGRNLDPQLYPATKVDPSTEISIAPYSSPPFSINEEGSISVDSLDCGEISETLPLWTKGTPSSEKEHVERLLQILHRVHLSSKQSPNLHSPRMAEERTTAALLYRILFLSKSKTSRSAEHPHIDRIDFIEWGACFLRGTVSSVSFPIAAGEFVEQPQRILFLYSETIDEVYFRHGFGLSLACCQPQDIVAVLYGCEYVLLLRKSHRKDHTTGEDTYKVLGQCYSSTLDTSLDSGEIASRNFDSSSGPGFGDLNSDFGRSRAATLNWKGPQYPKYIVLR